MTATGKARNDTTDAVEMLKADHKEVKSLFNEFASLKVEGVDNDAEKSRHRAEDL
jgi:hypothetical protein